MCDGIVFMHCIPSSTEPQSCVKSWLCFDINLVHAYAILISRTSWLLFLTIDYQLHLRASLSVYSFPGFWLLVNIFNTKYTYKYSRVAWVQLFIYRVFF